MYTCDDYYIINVESIRTSVFSANVTGHFFKPQTALTARDGALPAQQSPLHLTAYMNCFLK
ncbi:hypothetical protein RF007C_13430 [Ruminococcus flavefaciens 007c]|uniref:Uncharacterized protein n=1 Tax=Ruminococcus flavefaciens 007c TaxID=1341157 RepID=W7UVI9_RUMFL|nr:hypothetical protein RF007C_13430 [Ruminococcus flavefaciens 007c]